MCAGDRGTREREKVRNEVEEMDSGMKNLGINREARGLPTCCGTLEILLRDTWSDERTGSHQS